MPDWVDGMKKVALNAYQNSQPCDLFFGTVTAESPLVVCIEDLKMELPAPMLLLPDYLTDKTVQVMVEGKTGTAMIPGALKIGDRVILVRKSGGQRYAVIGKGGSICCQKQDP